VVSDDDFAGGRGRELLCEQLKVQGLAGFGAEELTASLGAAGALLRYLHETQKQALAHINSLNVYSPSDYMVLDYTTQRSLELVQNLHSADRSGTLLGVLDRTVTAMGGRRLREWMLRPLKSREAIEERLGAVDEFTSSVTLRPEVENSLKGILDLERIMGRISCKTANARDLQALRSSLDRIPGLCDTMGNSRSARLQNLAQDFDTLDDLRERLARAVVDDPPLTLRDGGIIRNGYNAELDEIRSVSHDSKGWISRLREKEIKRTGINNLKIGFNRVFGYYIEVTKSYLSQVPGDYTRRQTLANAERFITPELKEKEEIILHAEERMQELEYQLFEELRAYAETFTKSVQEAARRVAEVDCLLSFATAALIGKYVRPRISDDDVVRIVEGRHPVLETIAFDRPFVPNDVYLDNREHQILLITGPNMAGKSTYIRQVALITLMAHIGSFVPAREASIGLVDRIFTRVGAMDQLIKGQSTFLVEMSESANILNNATSKSLVILDEIGRGTSTYDGLSIAWSVIEYLHNRPACNPKTLFATHYHELTDLEESLARVKNFNVSVLEEEDQIVFLYKIVRGSTDRSYGIYAAKLAGLPHAAVERAQEILFNLECGNAIEVRGPRRGGAAGKAEPKIVQLSLFEGLEHPALQRLRAMEPDKLTPLEALNILSELIKESKK
ncbi:MAG: DNA mismatch repair protein MutS, partial [bacterium]